ncbi:hypothetical protein [Streptomyces sp. NPDC093594]|uniref:phosphotransferase-like protein n=1 Tax=Streptomyces sp. NPDC093594 TaxID=3155305 RepID=UPI003450939E
MVHSRLGISRCQNRTVWTGGNCVDWRKLTCHEQAHGDRPAGLAVHQYGLVHSHGDYDLECDTSKASAVECPQRIKEYLPRRPVPTAFTRLRARCLPDVPST